MFGIGLGIWHMAVLSGGGGTVYIFTGGVWNNLGVWDNSANFWGP